MPNTKSAIKANRQSIKHRARNLAKKKAYKDLLKDFRKAVGADVKEAKRMLASVQKKLDKAAKTGVIAKNKASRLKGNAQKLLNKVGSK